MRVLLTAARPRWAPAVLRALERTEVEVQGSLVLLGESG